MKCHPCKTSNVPAKGTPYPGYCDACGWTITDKGALAAVSPEAISIVAMGDAFDAWNVGSVSTDAHAGDVLRRIDEEVRRRSKPAT